MRNKLAVIGLGNVGKYVLEAVKQSPDFECVGIVRRVPHAQGEFASVEELPQKPDVAILCVPSPMAEQEAAKILAKGIHVVDSFDIHTEIPATLKRLDAIAKQNNRSAIISCGWDPGTDSLLRSIFKVIAPEGDVYTNFGPGMSMGHSVVARSIQGVADAVSITLPLGKSKHARKVYVKPAPNVTEDELYKRIKADDYFAHDPLELAVVDDITPYRNTGHGVSIEMQHQNTSAEFKMRVNNPETTGRILLACARAALRQQTAGAYTIVDLPLVNLLPGSREEKDRKSVV